MVRKLCGSIRENKRVSVCSALFAGLEVLMEIVIPFLMAEMIDQGIYGGSMSMLSKFSLAMIVCVVLGLIFGLLANADGFITALPQGYQTMLTDAGAGLSQGQRQLLAIARAAVADPPAMILDEATSSIDTRTESMVQQGMDSLMEGRTTSSIRERLSLINVGDVYIAYLR